MSREVRRVPLEFDWPIGKVWGGYITPAELRLPGCGDCDGGGYTEAYRWLEAIAGLLTMCADDVRVQQQGKPLHHYLSRLENRPGERPSADILQVVAGLVGRGPDPIFGYLLGSDSYQVNQAILKAAGLPEEWGWCKTCGGTGEVATAEQKAARDAWEQTESPTGEGWQLWETVSEGSPTSPVFATADELATWMSQPERGRDWQPFPSAQKFVTAGWAPSFISTPETGVVAGVEWVGHHAPEAS